MKIKYSRSFRFLYSSLLGYLSYFSILPYWLSPLLNKLRGVKINSIFNVYIAPFVLIDSLYPELVTIEDEVYLTRNVTILTHTNYTKPLQELLGRENSTGPVKIGYGTFVGIGATILPRITIGRCVVIRPGAIVTSDIPDYAIVEGNPARVVGDIRGRKKGTTNECQTK